MKRNLVKILIGVITCCISSQCWARLGESIAENTNRYGAPVSSALDKQFPLLDGATNLTFYFQGWSIRIAFLEDKAVRIRYSKLAAKNVALQIQPDELKAIFDGEGGADGWKETSKPLSELLLVTRKRYVHSNGNTAISDSIMITLDTPAVAVYLKQTAETQEKTRKKAIPKF